MSIEERLSESFFSRPPVRIWLLHDEGGVAFPQHLQPSQHTYFRHCYHISAQSLNWQNARDETNSIPVSALVSSLLHRAHSRLLVMLKRSMTQWPFALLQRYRQHITLSICESLNI
jgi:hypothetical protein